MTDAVTVVVAEDEAIIRMDLVEVLREEGYAVVADTGRGDDAVRLVAEHRPDLALLDIKMPSMSITVAMTATLTQPVGILMPSRLGRESTFEHVRRHVDHAST